MRALGFFICFSRQHSHEVAKQFGIIAKYSHVFAYIHRCFGQKDFSGTGTISKAARLCQWGESTNHFSQKIKGELSAFSLFWAPACPSSTKQFGVIGRYSQVLAYIQRSFGQENFNAIDTMSKVERACQWAESNRHFT